MNTTDGHEFVERILSFADGQPFSDGTPSNPKLSIERVKSLIKRFPYNPGSNGENTLKAEIPTLPAQFVEVRGDVRESGRVP